MNPLLNVISSEIQTAIFTGVVGLVGALIGGWLSWSRETRRVRTSMIFDFHKEYDTGELTIARAKAHELLIKHSDLRMSELNDAAEVEESLYLWSLLNFYHRLWLSVKYKRVDRKLVFPLFGESLIWWAQVHFKDRLEQDKRDSVEAILELDSWLARKYRRNKKYKTWLERAKAEQTRYYK